MFQFQIKKIELNKIFLFSHKEKKNSNIKLNNSLYNHFKLLYKVMEYVNRN